jgi:hypothetical protein
MTSTRIHGKVGILALVLAGVGWSGSARGEGNGLKFGDGRVHPFLDVESRYDTAAMMLRARPSSDVIMHLRPGLKLEMPSPRFAVNLNGNVDFLLYAQNSGLSRVQGEGDLDVGVNRGGQYGFDIGDRFTRTDRVTDPTFTLGVLSFFNEARAQVNLRPSGGALVLEPNYHLTTEWFSFMDSSPQSSSGITLPGSADYLTHTFSLNGRWKFLPKTAVTLDSAFAMRSYIGTRAVASTAINTLKVSAGLAGLLSSHLSTVLKAGYGRDFSQNTFSSVVGQAELGYILSESGQIKVGFVRTFEPVSGTQVSYTDHRIYLDGRMLLAGRLTLRALGSLDFISFNAGGQSTGTSASADLGADFELTRWLNLSAGYDLTYRQLTTDLMRHEVYGRLQFIY